VYPICSPSTDAESELIREMRCSAIHGDLTSNKDENDPTGAVRMEMADVRNKAQFKS
jgi:hypothetical protein